MSATPLSSEPDPRYRYALLLDRTSRSPSYKILASCAVVGKECLYYGLTRTFENEMSLRAALNEARVADFEMDSAIQTVKSGFRSFAYIAIDQAKSLKLLGDVDHSC